jgi:hypothetical protein
MSRPALEIADIFRDHGAAWRKANAGHVSLDQMKVMSTIERCRTAALGRAECSRLKVGFGSRAAVETACPPRTVCPPAADVPLQRSELAKSARKRHSPRSLFVVRIRPNMEVLARAQSVFRQDVLLRPDQHHVRIEPL